MIDFITGFLSGWVARDVFTTLRKRQGGFSVDTPRPSSTTILMPKDDFTSRIVSNIPDQYWRAVGQAVVAMRAKNLNGSVIKRALPNMPQEEQRALRSELVGLLEPEHVGVLVMKGNAAEITHPVGWSFFKRISRGMVSPFHKFNLPHTPQDRDVSQIGVITQHTRATRAESR